MVFFSGYNKTIEKKIKQAVEKGEFDNLPGKGQPLKLEDDSHVPEELRLAYKILKNADFVPPEVQLRKEIRQMEDLLDDISDEREKIRQIKRINYKIMKLNAMGRGSPILEEQELYYEKIVDKMGKKK